jgi:hypothetical protein
MTNEKLSESQEEKCADQASKIVALKHELGLIGNYIDIVSFVSVLDKNEAAGAIHGMLIGEGALDNMSRTIEIVLDNLEDIANTLFNISESEEK